MPPLELTLFFVCRSRENEPEVGSEASHFAFPSAPNLDSLALAERQTTHSRSQEWLTLHSQVQPRQLVYKIHDGGYTSLSVEMGSLYSSPIGRHPPASC